MNILMTIFFNLISSLIMIYIVCLIVKRGIKKTEKKFMRENYSRNDIIKTKDYYRDILKEYSPDELSFIDEFKIEEHREIVAILLSLKLKKKGFNSVNK